MQDIMNIKIVGIDEKRPPLIQKEPYIDLFFQLSHKVPEDWCEDFNDLTKKLNPPIKIDKGKALFIETYVRDMNQIVKHLETIKHTIITCNEHYIKRCQERELAAQAKMSAVPGISGKQSQLNAIVDALNYSN